MSRTKLVAITMVVSVTLLGWLTIAPRAQSTPAVPLGKSIVGSWRGDAVFSNPRTNFGRTDLEMRFNDYGIVTVSRGPMPGRPVFDRWVGDYAILGNSVLISPHVADGGTMVLMLGVTVEDDRLESVSPGGTVSDFIIGTGIRLRRQ